MRPAPRLFGSVFAPSRNGRRVAAATKSAFWTRILAETTHVHMTNLQRSTRAMFAGVAAAVTTTAIAAYVGVTRTRRKRDDAEWQEVLRNEAHTAAFVPPTRSELLQRLRNGGVLRDDDGAQKENSAAAFPNDKPMFDVLVVGGGATGAGCALDAAVRGLNVACVERGDFASGTSSKSTKLVHGGVRYLEAAIKQLDIAQYRLVTEALRERATFLRIAPHLTDELPIALPVYRPWLVPYFWAGSKVYDALAGSQSLTRSFFMSRAKTLAAFPLLRSQKLCGSVVYFDGQQNDARMNVSLALTAIAKGATVLNYVEVVRLMKQPESTLPNAQERVCGAVVRDTLTGETFEVRARAVVNATGPFCDAIRRMDDAAIAPIVAPSAGVHIVLPARFGPAHMGLLDASSSDGRVIFFLPWQGHIVAGTTDTPTHITQSPIPAEADIEFLLREVAKYFSEGTRITRADVTSAWAGIRPLVRDPAAVDTQSLVRNHMINFSSSGLLTISGGKWTTYRAMAQETIDAAASRFNLPLDETRSTAKTPLIGAHGFGESLLARLRADFALDADVAAYLHRAYGDRALQIAAAMRDGGSMRIHAAHPHTVAEVRHAVHREYAATAVDVLARRTRLAFLDARAAFEALPRVISLMAADLKWDAARREAEFKAGVEFLKTMAFTPQPDHVQCTE